MYPPRGGFLSLKAMKHCMRDANRASEPYEAHAAAATVSAGDLPGCLWGQHLTTGLEWRQQSLPGLAWRHAAMRSI